MATKKKIAKQWLETDAAFGAAEAPVARPRKRPASAAAAPIARPAPARPVIAAVAPVRAKVEQAFSPSAAPAPTPSRPAPTRASAASTIFEAPPGNISALPVMTRDQKIAALAALLQETTRELSKYLDEVATKVVFGEGDPDAPVMFIGEGPGIEEDRQGRPFVGKSGQLLDKQIAAMKFTREQVYIANVVKLRAASPSEEWGGRLKDRPPTPEEVARNIGFLHRQIEIIRPQAIVTLGAPSLKYITNSKEGVTKIRGTWLSYRGIPVMPTLHPAYVLRNYTEDTRRKVWDDLKAVLAKIGKK